MDPDPLLEDVRRAMAALAEPHRFRLARLLRDQPRAVGDLVGLLGLPQPLVSHHLSVLSRAGLVQADRDGRRRMYRLAGMESPRLRALLELVHLWPPGPDAPAVSAAIAPSVSAPRESIDRSGEIEDYLL